MLRAKDKQSWVLIADASICKIFFLDTKTNMISALVETFHSTEARLHAVNLGIDRPGRIHSSYGTSTKSAVEPKIDLQKKEKERFSHLIAEFLDKQVSIQKVEKLILIAPPTFLGKIRKRLTKKVFSIVTKEINKDLIHATEKEIIKHIGIL